MLDRADNVEPIDKYRMTVQAPVAIGVFMDTNAILAREMFGRRRRHFVIDRAPHTVVTNARQARG